MLGSWKRLIIFVLFFVSGAAGLIYEVVWAKHLSLLLGNTTQAHTIVLATFMGGLALGYFLFGRVADTSRGILRLYGWLEIAIGLCGGLFVAVIDELGAVYIWLLSELGTASLVASALKLTLSMLLILPPTVLMGGTLPLLSRLLVRLLGDVEQQVARLYFVNSFGAAVGSVLAGFVLIPSIGLNLSILIGVALNLTVGWAAVALRSWEEETERTAITPPSPTANTPHYTPLALRIAVLGIALSGAAALIYEIAWIRLLSLILGSSAYSFSLMLTAFIFGIALGSLAVTHRAIKQFDPYLLFCLAELGVVVSIVLTLPLYVWLPYYFNWVANLFIRVPETFWLYSVTQFSVCLLLMLFPTFFLGMTLPLLSQAVTQNLTVLGRKIGSVFGANTIGTLIGAYLAGLVLLPALGIKRMIEFGVLVNLLVGASALYFVASVSRQNKILILVPVFGIFFAHLYLDPSWDQRVFSSGVYRDRRLVGRATYEQFRKLFSEEVLYYKDGANATVAITKSQKGEIRLKVNGKTDASSHGDLPTQILLGQIPLLLQPQAQRVLVIGLGSGITARSVLQHPVAHLDIAEISPEVVAASKFFFEPGDKILEDPRVTVHIEDAKAFLKVGAAPYDVIISEPSNPWIAGIANLYSIEFFRDMRNRLQPDGLVVQWIHSYEMTDETLSLILRTFATSFEHVTLWNPMVGDLILVGSKVPLNLDFAQLKARFDNPKVRQDLRRLGIESLAGLLSVQAASDKGVRDAAGQGPVNEDLFPKLEYEAPKAFFLGNASQLLNTYDERRSPRKDAPLYLSLYLHERRLGPKEIKEMAAYHSIHSHPALARNFAEHWLRMAPHDPEARWMLARMDLQKGNLEAANRELDYLLSLKPGQQEYLEAAVQIEWQTYLDKRSVLHEKSPEKALDYLRRLLESDGTRKDQIYHRMAQIQIAARNLPAAIGYLEKAASHARTNHGHLNADALWLEAAGIAIEMADTPRALDYLRKALAHNPENSLAKIKLSELSRASAP